MSDGLSFLFELDSKMDGLNTAVSRMEKLHGELEVTDAATKRVTTALNEADGAFYRASASVRALAKDLGMSSARADEMVDSLVKERGPSFMQKIEKEMAGKPLKRLEDGAEDAKGEIVDLDAAMHSLRMEQFATGVKHGGEAAQHMSHDISGVTHELHKMGTFIKGLTIFEVLKLGFEGVHHVVEKAGEKIWETVNVAAKADRLSFAFKSVFGEGAHEAEEWADRFSRVSELTEEQSKRMAVGLGRVGFRGRGMSRAMSAASDLAAMSVNPEEGAQSALSAIERIYRTGRIDNRSLGAFGFGAKALAAELAALTGKSQKAVAKGLKSGEGDVSMNLEMLYSMIAKKTGQKLGGFGLEASKTLSARLAKLRELPEQFMEKFKDTRGFSVLNDALGRFLERFNPEGPAGKKITAWIEHISERFAGWIDSVDVGALLDKVELAIGGIMKAVDLVRAAFAPVIYLLGEAMDKLEIIQGFAAGKSYDDIMVERTRRDFRKKNGVSIEDWGAASRGFLRYGETGPAASADPLDVPTFLKRKAAPAHASGGIVVGLAGGMAVVKPAPGEGMASVGPGETIVPRGGGAGAQIYVDLTVQHIGGGSGDAYAEAQALAPIVKSAVAQAFGQVAMELGA